MQWTLIKTKLKWKAIKTFERTGNVKWAMWDHIMELLIFLGVMVMQENDLFLGNTAVSYWP